MGRLAQEKQNNDDRLMVFRVGNDEVKLSNNLVKRYLVSGQGNVTDQEIMYFMKLCKARNLNPFVKDAYLIKYTDKDPATVVVAKDASEKRAIQHPQYNGKKVGIYVENKETGVNTSELDDTPIQVNENEHYSKTKIEDAEVVGEEEEDLEKSLFGKNNEGNPFEKVEE